MAKQKTSFTLSLEAMELLKKIAEKSGISMAAALEIMIRDVAKKQKV